MSLLLTGVGPSGTGVTPEPADPLAGIALALRFETHNGNGVPRGMYTDLAGTIPAVEFDAVACVRNWRNGNGIILTQSVFSMRPLLVMDGGFPFLSFDGIDDGLYSAVSLSNPYSILTGARVATPQNTRMINSLENNRVFSFNRTPYAIYIDGSVTDTTTINPGGSWAAGSLVVGASSHIYIDGIDRTTDPSFTSDWGTVLIAGPNLFGDGFSTAETTSLILATSALSPADRQTVETYLATLNP